MVTGRVEHVHGIEMWNRSWSHLGEQVPSEQSVFGDFVRYSNRDKICKSLNLMDDSLSVRHFGAVIKGWWAV